MNNLAKGPIAWMAQNPVAANLLMALFLFAGFQASFSIPKETFPSFPTETIKITVPYPGSSAEEVEDGILIKVEEAVQDIEGIKKITSTASESSGVVNVLFDAGHDMSIALNTVKSRVDAISSFPLDAEPAIVEEILTTRRVITLNIFGGLNEHQLKALADEVRNDLLLDPAITQIKIDGVRDYEITIEIDSLALQAYNLSFDQVVNAVQNRSRDLPGGTIRTDVRTITLRSQSQARSADEYARLPIITRENGTRLLLGDVANVTDGFDERPILSRFDGKSAVSLTINQVGDENGLYISQAIKDYIAEKQQSLPPGVNLATAFDSTKVLKGRLSLMLKSAAQGAILVMITLTLFLHLRLAFWVMMGVPFCFMAAMTLMQSMGLTINVISLFGFILVLGIIVDDAIVVAESAYAAIEDEHDGVNSVVKGVHRVAVATLFGVLTTIIAFLPVLFIEEGIGRFFGVMASVVILSLLFSMVESKLILPAHLGHLRVTTSHESRNPILNRIYSIQNSVQTGLKNFITQKYRPLLHLALDNRYLTLIGFVGFAIISISLMTGGFVRFVYFPNVPSDYINITLDMPQGSSHQQTTQYALHLEAAAEKVNKRFQEHEGTDKDAIVKISTITTSDTSARINSELIASTERNTPSPVIAKWWREEVGDLPDIQSISFDANAGPDRAPIDIEINSDDLEQLRQASEMIKAALREFEGVFDIRDTLNDGGPEINVSITPEGEALGLGQAELARQVRQAFFGSEIQRFQRERHEVRVYARLPKEDRISLEALDELWINLPNGTQVPFNVVGIAKETKGLGSINRINRTRVVNVKADIDKANVEPGAVMESLKQNLFPTLSATLPHVSLHLGGEAEDQEKNNAVLLSGTIVVIIMIYAALAIPLKSYFQPFIILSVVPFGFVGAIWGHFILGQDLSILSIIGIVALIGITVNDSLVLVDYINQQAREGVDKIEAIYKSGEKRFRAVLLTSVTTFMGLLPIQLETSIQAQFLKPMAVSVSFGVMFATLVTLILIPCLSLVGVDIHSSLSNIFSKEKSGSKI